MTPIPEQKLSTREQLKTIAQFVWWLVKALASPSPTRKP